MPDYTLGPADPRRDDYARFETKPPAWTGRRWDTGAGYERHRSYEYRPKTSRQGTEDVYVSVHRLCAVAWKLPPDAPLSALDGVDVHHSAPEVDRDWGIPWDNREDALHLLDHGRHSEVTQAEMRAYGEDAKRRAESDEWTDDRSVRCGESPDVACESADWEGVACLECGKALSDGAPIEVV